MNSSLKSQNIQLQVDREHSGLRLGMVGLFLAILVIVFIITNALVSSEGFNILAGLVAFGVAAIFTRLADPLMKRWWPSKRSLQMDSNGARLMLDDKVQAVIHAEATANVHYWRFKIPRRGRMPRGWYVVACALQQDDAYLPLYTFASPAQTENLNKIKPFTDLHSEKNNKAASAKGESLRLAGEQRRLRLAEEHRWQNGGELTVDDFETFIKQLNEQYVQWNT